MDCRGPTIQSYRTHQEEFIDSREATSTTNVSLSNVSIATSTGASAGESLKVTVVVVTVLQRDMVD